MELYINKYKCSKCGERNFLHNEVDDTVIIVCQVCGKSVTYLKKTINKHYGQNADRGTTSL
jgi:predicted nucleic acid-binding Zn ribbon protein